MTNEELKKIAQSAVFYLTHKGLRFPALCHSHLIYMGFTQGNPVFPTGGFPCVEVPFLSENCKIVYKLLPQGSSYLAVITYECIIISNEINRKNAKF